MYSILCLSHCGSFPEEAHERSLLSPFAGRRLFSFHFHWTVLDSTSSTSFRQFLWFCLWLTLILRRTLPHLLCHYRKANTSICMMLITRYVVLHSPIAPSSVVYIFDFSFFTLFLLFTGTVSGLSSCVPLSASTVEIAYYVIVRQ